MLKLFKKVDPIEVFWSWFYENKDRISKIQPPHDPMIQEIGKRLQKISPALCWESSEDDFVVSADGIRAVFPLVEKVVAAEPRMPGWTVTAFRQPKDADLTMGGRTYDGNSVRIVVAKREGLTDVTVFLDGLNEENRDSMSGAGFLLLDCAIGEYDVATKLGAINFQPMALAPGGHLPLSDLKDYV